MKNMTLIYLYNKSLKDHFHASLMKSAQIVFGILTNDRIAEPAKN